MAANTWGIGTRSAGSSPKGSGPRHCGGRDSGTAAAGCFAASAGGIMGGIGLFSFIGHWWLVSVGLKKVSQRGKNIFVKISVKGVRAEKFHRQRREADERAQNPRKLAARKRFP